MQAAAFGLRIGEVPARGRYFEDASSVGLGRAPSTGSRRCGWAFAWSSIARGILHSRKFRP